MGRQSKKKTSASDLVNFHFSSPSQSQMEAPRRPRRNNPQHRDQYRRSEKDRSSARRKAESSMFYLHSSPDHAFHISRRSKQGYSFSGSDVAVSWENVRSVKYLSPSTDATLTEESQESCPICLDSFICPRITKCGHVFCLTCILRHVHSHAEDTKAVQCPCCSLPIHVCDFRVVTLQTVLPPRLQSKLKLIKLHRTKDCPAPYLPRRGSFKHSSPHTAPTVTDGDASFCRFNYVEPLVYQSQLTANCGDLESQLMELYHQVKAYPSASTEMVVVQMALESVKIEQQKAADEVEEEQALLDRYSGTNTGMYQKCPPSLFAKDWPTVGTEAAKEAGTDMVSDSAFDTSEITASEGRRRGGSIDSTDTVDSKRKSSKRRGPRRLPDLPASMYLEPGATQFYQSDDGQLVFLSKFNMSCLLEEFSTTLPETAPDVGLTPVQRRRLQPLPDVIEGTVLEIENIHLTPERRKRMPFLSHLPLHTDIKFVELDLNAILSGSTKQKFAAEFEKRRKKRKGKKESEKKADRLAKKQEEARIEELKSRIQRIDPNDEFFLSSSNTEQETLEGDAFGPILRSPSTGDDEAQISSSPTASHTNPALSFSAITGRGFSVLNPSNMPGEEAFPSLMSSAGSETTSMTKPTRDRPVTSGWYTAHTRTVDPVPGQQPPGSGKKGKKAKGKKIVLFSTGGHRGAS